MPTFLLNISGAFHGRIIINLVFSYFDFGSFRPPYITYI